MLSSIIFLILQVFGVLFAQIVFVPVEFRPPLSVTPGAVDVGYILVLATVGAGFLLFIKLFVPLRWISHFVVFLSGIYLGGFFNLFLSLATGVMMFAMRLTKNIWAVNLSTCLAAISFGLMFGSFVSPEFSMLLIAALSVYDSVGVLYLKYIQKIWLGQHGTNHLIHINLEKILDGILVAIPSTGGYEITGVGDFALPLVLVVSIAKSNPMAGIICALCATIGYHQLRAVRGKIMPGMPFIGVGCLLGLLTSAALGLV